MDYNLKYTCPYCNKELYNGAYGFKLNDAKYHFYKCWICNRKINMYALWMQNEDKLDEIIKIIIYNFVDSELRNIVKDLYNLHTIDFAKMICQLYEESIELYISKINMKKLINNIEILKIKNIDDKKIVFADVKLLYPRVHSYYNDSEYEIYCMFKFDCEEYIRIHKIMKFLN